MARIYGYSFLTIAAELAGDSSQGIFCDRPRQQGVTVPSYRDGISYGIVSLHKIDAHSSLELSPLSMQAWTFQEREMACRTLHYNKSSVSFQCKRGATDETEGFDYNKAAFSRLFNWLDDRTLYSMVEQAPDKWYGYIAKYSSGDLTFESDKLPVISGLANEMQHTIQSCYLAGLWQCDLLYGLTWRSYRHPGHAQGRIKARRRQGRGPTWSWASVNSAVGNETLEKPGMVKENSAGGSKLPTGKHPSYHCRAYGANFKRNNN